MGQLPTYDIEKKPFEKLNHTGKIFHALMHGAHLSPATANDIADTTEGTRFIRFIRQDGHPVETEKFKSKAGGTYYRYFFSKEQINAIKEQLS